MYITYLIDAYSGKIVDANADNEFTGVNAFENLTTFIKTSFKTNPSLMPQLHGQPLNPPFLFAVEKRLDKKDENYIFYPSPFTEIERKALEKLLPNSSFLKKHTIVSQPLMLIKTRYRFAPTF